MNYKIVKMNESKFSFHHQVINEILKLYSCLITIQHFLLMEQHEKSDVSEKYLSSFLFNISSTICGIKTT